MRGKLFKHMFLVAMSVFVACTALFMWSLYSYFTEARQSEQREETAYAAAAGRCTAVPAMRRPASAATKPAPQPTRTCSTRACPSTALPPSTRTSPPRRRSQQQGNPCSRVRMRQARIRRKHRAPAAKRTLAVFAPNGRRAHTKRVCRSAQDRRFPYK